MASPSSQQKPDLDRTAQRTAAEFVRVSAGSLEPGLYVIATPIGNLADITVRALSVLARADAVYCEDTRHSRTLLSHYSIGTSLRPYHEHNAEEQRPRILTALADGQAIALISDAGTPLISDPGYKLVRDVAAGGHQVFALPGASATLAGLAVSGLPTDAFFFAGFLPVKEGQRRARIAELAMVPATLAFFEAPGRVAATLSDLAAVLGNRPGAVARELTKLHENVIRAPLLELAATYQNEAARGEFVLLVGPPLDGDVDDEAIRDRLREALDVMSVRDAAKAVAERLNVPRSRAYDLALGLKKDR